jgi:arginine/lysine/ornithine decarboxylase
MLTPEISDIEIERLEKELLSIPELPEIEARPPKYAHFERKMSIREATMFPCETLAVEHCDGRVLARLGVSCPPAVPIAVSGEIITKDMIECFKYYGIKTISVVK